MSSTVGTKGQIVIEKSIRDALGLRPGYIAVQRLVGDHVEIYFYPPEHRESLRGILAGHVRQSIPAEQWAVAREEAWANTVREEWHGAEVDG